MAKHVVGTVGEIPPGERKIVELEGRSIGVFNVKGSFYALRNACPHQSGPLCRGRIKGLLQASDPWHLELSREGEIIRCPWHGWEFDLTNGQSVFNPHKLRVRAYEVTIEPEAPDPSIETYPVTIDRDRIVVHVNS
ncbi:MAG TPA: Rieske (2Fe-2S) protein [Chloroflexota bacterium]|nr:Rieske (2Fe-2S) protein [Chloroflexota bacterium]